MKHFIYVAQMAKSKWFKSTCPKRVKRIIITFEINRYNKIYESL